MDYVYDWVGNRTSPGGMQYNAADQLTSWPNQHTYEYYNDGSLHYQKDASGNVQQTHSYTFDGLLSSIAHAVGGTSSMTWDADQNRISFTSSTGGTTTFVYDITAGIPAVIAEVTTGGTVYYVREPNGALLARIAGETTHYYHFDDLGSTLMLTGAGGTVTDTYAYDAWGNVTNHTGSTEQPYKYVGQLGYYTHYQDVNMSGLLQLGVRYYSPEIGRFAQRDAWTWLPGDPRILGGLFDESALFEAIRRSPILHNLYLYGRDTPSSWVDPSGRGSWKCKNPLPSFLEKCLLKLIGRGAHFYWCRGCQADCVRWCNDNLSGFGQSNEWDECMNACKNEFTPCTLRKKWKFEAKW